MNLPCFVVEVHSKNPFYVFFSCIEEAEKFADLFNSPCTISNVEYSINVMKAGVLK